MLNEMCLTYHIKCMYCHISVIEMLFIIKAALIVSGCWQRTSRIKLYDEFGWESLSDRRWVRRLTLFYKIINGFALSYLSPHIPTRNGIGMTLRNRQGLYFPPIRTERYANSFFHPLLKNETFK